LFNSPCRYLTIFRALLAQPNAAHRAIAQFSIAERRQETAPLSNFALITQNVDGLSVRALKGALATLSNPAASASDSPLFEMHGRIHDIRCTSASCGATELDFSSPICEGLRGTDALMEAEVADPELPLEKLPRCKKCQALARPGVVWFGERPVHMDEIDALIEEADLCIVVGTSSTVRDIYNAINSGS
jgi:NAD-dependent deacetylase sirtuin 5